MKIDTVYVRFFRSFNYDYLRKAHPKAEPRGPWERLPDDSWYPFVEVALEAGITTVVGANEAGKSQLLDAIKYALIGEGISQRDFCRYSRFFVVNKQLNHPDFGLKFTHLTPGDREIVGKCAGLGTPLQDDSFLLFRLNRQAPVIYVPGSKGFLVHPILDEAALGLILPSVFEIDSAVPLPDNVPIRYLATGSAEEEVAPLPGHVLMKKLRKAKKAWFETPAAVQTHAAEINATFGSLSEAAPQALKQFALARQLLVKIAGVEPETFESLADAIDRGDEGHARGLITQINQELAKNLNFPRYWSQDSDFALVVSHTELDLHFTISDRTGTEYSFVERSGGLKYFLSYFVQVLAHGLERTNANEILLMDEPDAFLSSNGQQDLLSIFRDFSERQDQDGVRAQVVYVTHSPFLIDKNHSERIRVLDKGQGDEGTRVVADVARNHYEPLRSAFGGFVGETTFISNCNLLLEGLSDQILLAGVSAHLQRQRTPTSQYLNLNEITLVPAGSASHIPYLAYLARGRDATRPAVIVLLDGDQAGNHARKTIKKGGAYGKPVVSEQLVLMVDELPRERIVDFVAGGAKQLEDLIPPATALDGAKRYVRDTLGLEAHRKVETCGVDDLDFASGISTHDALTKLLQQNLGQEFHLDKVGLARSVIDRLHEGLASSDDAVFMANFRVLFTELNRLKAHADAEALAERAGERIHRVHKAFLMDNPDQATREQGGLLLDQIERDLGDSPKAEDWRLAVRKVRREFQLDDNLLEAIDDYEAFKRALSGVVYFEFHASADPALPPVDAALTPPPAVKGRRPANSPRVPNQAVRAVPSSAPASEPGSGPPEK